MNLLICDPINEKALEALKELGEVEYTPDITPEDLLKKIPEFEVLIVRSRTKVPKEVIDAGKNLKAICRAGVGLDNIDTEYAKSKGIQIINTPEAPTESVAELAITLILSLLRKIPKADSSTKKKEWLKKELTGQELMDKTLGVIGFGRIGHRTAQLAKAFGAKILVSDPSPKEKYLKEVGAELVPLEKLLKDSDIITIHAPLVEDTKNMLSEKEFSLMKDGSYLVNTARGAIVNEEALYNALKSKKLAGAAFDVYWEKTPFNSKIMELDNVILMPHIGSTTKEAQERIGTLLVKKLKELK